MKTYSSLKYKRTQPSVIALGCFDGIHVGHVKVIETAINIARKSECEAVVFTFEDSPKNFFLQGSAPSLTDKKEKKELISALGADVLICTPFNEAIARMSPEDFFEDIIKSSLLASHIVCGFNYTFGARGAGNVDLLQKLCKENGINDFFLEVREKNEAAQGLYKKFGFTPCGKRKGYYSNPTDNAVLMNKKM